MKGYTKTREIKLHLACREYSDNWGGTATRWYNISKRLRGVYLYSFCGRGFERLMRGRLQDQDERVIVVQIYRKDKLGSKNGTSAKTKAKARP